MRITLGTKHQLDEGTHEIPPHPHAQSRGHQCSLDLTAHRDPNALITVDFEVSTDAGATWAYGGGFTMQGGASTIDKNGDPQHFVHTAWTHDPLDAPPVDRLVRGTVTVTGGSVPTRVHVVGTRGHGLDKTLMPALTPAEIPEAFTRAHAAEKAAQG